MNTPPVPLPASSRYALTPDLTICRLPVGMWQVGGIHGVIEPADAVRSMFDLLDAGFTTFDLADIYGPAEEFIGEFRRQLIARRDPRVDSVQAFTKWVPRPGPMTRSIVEQAITRSCQRMGVSTLDLLQFHWWEYSDPRYMDALRHLMDLRAAGRIRHLALTNFDTKHLQMIRDAGVEIVSNQVQFSLIDQRPEVQLIRYCQEHGVKLLCYGTVCGGLLSERYLGRPEPGPKEMTTASLTKYSGMIDRWGGWELFQELLAVVAGVARKHRVSIANVAVRAILDRPTVAGAIVGCRLGLSDRMADNRRVFEFQLDDEDRAQIGAVQRKGFNLFEVIGDCGDEYR